MSDVTDLIDSSLSAWRVRDVDAYLAYFATDCQVVDFAGAVLMDGHAAMRPMYGELFEASPQLAVEVTNRIAVGEFVVDHESLSGMVSPTLPPEMQSVVAYRVSGGLIARMLFAI